MTNEMDTAWRKFFAPQMQLALCKVIGERYGSYARLCLSFDLILEPKYVTANLAEIGSGDLSALFQNMGKRFDSILSSRNKGNFYGTIQEVLLRFEPFCSNRVEPTKVPALKAEIQGCREFHNVCNIIRNSRNLHAHVLEPIGEVGHALTTASAIIRLAELCDTESFREEIETLRGQSEQILTFALPYFNIDERSAAKKGNSFRAHSAPKGPPQTAQLPEPRADQLENTKEKNTELDSEAAVNQKAPIAPYEQKRRQLLDIRIVSLKNPELIELGMNARNCPLNRQSIFEILHLSIDRFSEARNCPSIAFLSDDNPQIMEKFESIFASNIDEILGAQ